VAFGFRRQSGTGRGYVNESSPDFAIGQRLSRRQYDKYIETLGKRTHLPGADAIRETERRLESLREQLLARAADLDTRETALRLRELELEFEQAQFRKARQNAGQRRYNALLDAYVGEQRRRGKRIGKREASQTAEFKQLVADVRGRPNKRGNPNIRDQNRFNRLKALDAVGGGLVFREYYEMLYGRQGQLGASHARAHGKFAPGMTAAGRSIVARRRVA
jgi:hypothetical protein